MPRFKLIISVFAAFAIFTLASCSSDDNGSASDTTEEPVTTSVETMPSTTTAPEPDISAEAQPYVDALVSRVTNDEEAMELEPAQRECVADHFVNIIGVDRFEAAGVTPEGLITNGIGMSFAEVGLSSDEGYQLYDSLDDCNIKMRKLMIERFASRDGLTEDAKECIANLFTDDSTRDFVAIRMSKGEDGLKEDPAGAAIFGGVMSCASIGMNSE